MTKGQIEDLKQDLKHFVQTTVTQSEERLAKRMDRLEDRFSTLEQKVGDGFAKVDDAFAGVAEAIEEINMRFDTATISFQ